MVEENLRALSARIRALEPDVKKAFERLDAKWKAVSDELSELLIPCTISYKICDTDDGDGREYLEWRKWNRKWRICHLSQHFEFDLEGTVTPLDEWSAERKYLMLEHLPDFFEAVAAQVQHFIEATKSENGQ